MENLLIFHALSKINQISFLYFCFIRISTSNGYFITLNVPYSWLSLGIFLERTKFCFLFLLFRVSSYCRSKRCQTQTASLPTRSPGQYSEVLTARTLVYHLFKFSCNTAVGQMGRLDETHSPTKKLPPESTPQVMFTGFEPIQVQQYTKVIFDSISTKTDNVQVPDLSMFRASCLTFVCMFLYYSGFLLWEVK